MARQASAIGVRDLRLAESPNKVSHMLSLIIGTNRPGSNTRRVAAQIESIYQELDAPLHVIDLAVLPVETFNPDSYAEKPRSFKPIARAVREAQGLIVVTPEYNGGLPGVLKYFIDMLPFPESFQHKPVCFVGLSAGRWGALRPVEQLQQIFGYRNAYLYPERVFLPQINDLLDASGRFNQPEVQERLKNQAFGFLSYVDKLRVKQA